MTTSPDDQTFKIAARQDAMKWKAATTTLPDDARVPGKYRNDDALPFRMPREISSDDAAWALATARAVVDAVERLLATDPPDLFS